MLRNVERFLGALFCRTRSRRRHRDHPTRRRRRPARSRRGQRSASPVSSVLSSGPQHLHIQVRCDGTTARRARLMHRPTTTPGAPYIDRTMRSPTQLSLDAHAQLSRRVGARPPGQLHTAAFYSFTNSTATIRRSTSSHNGNRTDDEWLTRITYSLSPKVNTVRGVHPRGWGS